MRKKTLVGLVIIVLLGIGLAFHWPGRQVEESFTPDNLLRFHVLANSDSAADQQLKAQVRDVVLAHLRSKMETVSSVEEAETIIANDLREIEQIAESKVREAGQSYPVVAELGRFNFPTRSYGQLTLPAGEYTALRVVIGEGEGANWWCVLFPPLCFVNISNSLAAEPAWDLPEGRPVFAPQGKRTQFSENAPRVRWKFWELVSTLGR
ncbi:MAG: stage II sporulation protein R [Firmicutes bacterium]|nr:stage II sporulation protein R [Bacillota bacterium]